MKIQVLCAALLLATAPKVASAQDTKFIKCDVGYDGEESNSPSYFRISSNDVALLQGVNWTIFLPCPQYQRPVDRAEAYTELTCSIDAEKIVRNETFYNQNTPSGANRGIVRQNFTIDRRRGVATFYYSGSTYVPADLPPRTIQGACEVLGADPATVSMF